MRLPLASDIDSRDGTSSKDSSLTNMLKETQSSGELAVVRPGLVLDAVASGVGNGLVVFNNELVSVYGATLGVGVVEGGGGASLVDVFNLPLDGTLVDSVGHVVTALDANQLFDSGVTVCGTASYKFTDVSAACEITAAVPDDFGIGYSDFTLEAWCYPRNSVTQAVIIDRSSQTGSSDSFGLTCSGSEVLFGLVDDLGGSIQLAASGLSLTNTWIHVAIVRDADDVNMYVNGVLLDTATGGSNIDILGFDPADVYMYFGGGPCNLTNILFATGVKYTGNFTPACVFSTDGSIPTIGTITGDYYDFAQSPI